MRISVEMASQLLNEGNIVAVPTETVYGLAASLLQPEAIQSIFSLKGRPANNPLIIHLAEVSELANYTQSLPPSVFSLAADFWPGPMTLVLPIRETSIPYKVRAGLSTAAFRIPSHKAAHRLLQKTGPLVMPSANLSGKPSATSADHIEHDFGLSFPILDGGDCLGGLESTILLYQQEKWRVIRLGALPPECFDKTLGYVPLIDSATSSQPLCPGQLYRHYAPETKLTLLKEIPADGSGIILGYRDREYPSSYRPLYLGELSQPEKVAENLYTTLRTLDLDSIPSAWVDINVPHAGLWLTILERLAKASNG